MISGKEALIALANGEVVEVQYLGNIQWYEVLMAEPLSTLKESGNNFRLKPRTITINGIEVPAPFVPKDGDTFYTIETDRETGYNSYSYINNNFCRILISNSGAWRTEEEIKQVVEALRNVFNP